MFSLLHGAGCQSKQGITQPNPVHPEKIKLLSRVKTYTAIEQEHCLHLKTQLFPTSYRKPSLIYAPINIHSLCSEYLYGGWPLYYSLSFTCHVSSFSEQKQKHGGLQILSMRTSCCGAEQGTLRWARIFPLSEICSALLPPMGSLTIPLYLALGNGKPKLCDVREAAEGGQAAYSPLAPFTGGSFGS